MQIKHLDSQNTFIIFAESQKQIGEIKYIPADNNELYAAHTEVSSDYEGQGLAGKLLNALVEYAREHNKKIVPICPYVISSFRKYPERYKDIMK